MIPYPQRAELPLPVAEGVVRDGAVGEFDAEGALVRLTTWADGAPSGLELSIDRARGEIVLASREVLTPADFEGGEDEDPASLFRMAVDSAVARVWDHVDPSRLMRCSFCEKRQHEVRRLIAGPTSYICDECITLCAEIIAEE